MSFSQVALLGAIAGFTIYLGLPAGRVKKMSDSLRAFLSMASAGILLFLLFDIFSQLAEPIEAALGERNMIQFFILFVIFAFGLGIGLLGLIVFEQRFIKSRAASSPALSPTRLALMIAIGIGLHNFSEGLAIGQSAGSGAIAFATILIVGFGLHNATEGFAIVSPLVGGESPSWKFLGLAGLIAGAPTFIGTIIGYYLISPVMSVLFLALAAGAIIYIIGELFHVNRKPGLRLAAGWGVFAGFLLAFLTDMVLVFAGV